MKDIGIARLGWVLFLITLLLMGCASPPSKELEDESKVVGDIGDTQPDAEGEIMIEGVGNFAFDPEAVETTRDDLFREGYFSLFDILVHLADKGDIDLSYHFDEAMNTHVIDSIDGEANWWYMAYYSGGWPENNVFRMDHFPYKDKMYIRIESYDPKMLDSMYEVFREEVERREQNDGKVIIPKVIISGPNTDLEFENVEVEAHDLRDDALQPGVITAIDAILTLGDQGELNYKLQWYDSIGSADVVRSYWVEGIDSDVAGGRCGFVYEAGSHAYEGFRGNHIHLPSDMRVLNSPEYLEYFWICI